MFKFVSKNEGDVNASSVFFNGQKLYTVYVGVKPEGEVQIQVEDGSNHLMKEWEDFLEDYERLN